MLLIYLKVTLKIWLVELTLTSVNCENTDSKTPNTYYLPKCCRLDKSLLFWKMECTPSPGSTNVSPWQPTVYQSASYPNVKANPTSKIVYQHNELPQNCSPIINDGSIHSGYRKLSTSFVKHPIIDEISHEKDHVKLILPESNGGKLKIMSFYQGSRKWLVDSFENYCVDRAYVESNNTSVYTGDINDFVVIYCPHQDEINENEIIIPENNGIPWTYAGISLLALIFLLATIIVYIFLWDKHNLHSMTILGYSMSTFGSYFFLVVAHLVSLLPDPSIAGLHNRGSFCYVVAALAHFFYLSSYLWLTVMNFDLWRTFKVIRVVGKNDKEWTKFGGYLSFALGLPALLIIIFVIIDHKYRDPLTEVPVPDYAVDSCFVSPEFRSQYLYTPMAILLLVNILLIGMTMWIFIQARSQSSKTFHSGSVSNAKRYNAQLFTRLFILMGGTSIVDFLTWYYNNKGYKPWLVVALESISYFIPVVLFFLFCWNDKIVNQLREKYPRVAEKLRPVLKIFKKDDNNSCVISTANKSPMETYKTGLSSSSNRLNESNNAKPLRSFEQL